MAPRGVQSPQPSLRNDNGNGNHDAARGVGQIIILILAISVLCNCCLGAVVVYGVYVMGGR